MTGGLSVAFCTKCGSQIRPGAGFCSECGAPLSRTGGGRSGKSSKPLIFGLIGGVVLIGLVFGILALTGVLGGAKGPVGTWQLAQPYNSDGDTYTLYLDKDGTGFLKNTVYNFYSVSTYYYPLKWDQSQIIFFDDWGDPTYCYYTWENRSLSFTADREYYSFVPSAVPEPYAKAEKPAPGTYQLTGYYEDGTDLSYQIPSEFGWMELTVNADRSSLMRIANEAESFHFTCDKYFFYNDFGQGFFYHYENGTITLIDDNEQFVLTRAR